MNMKSRVSERADQKALNPTNWVISESKDRMYTSDHVIDAYFEGKTVGLQQAEQLIFKSLQENIDRVGLLTSEILKFMNESVGFNPISARLKINTWSDFKVLILLPTKEFLSSNIFTVYEKITEMENESTTDFFHVNFSICNANENLDEACVISDGYNLRHKK